MYYLTKLIQATGLTIILIGFLYKFPALMSPKILLAGLVIFGSGWSIEKFILRKN